MDIDALVLVPGFLIPKRHTLDRINHTTEIVSLEFRILDTLLSPVLVESRDTILCCLEELNFISDAFLDEDTAGVLVDDGLFVLKDFD